MKKILLIGSEGQLGKEFANFFGMKNISFIGIDIVPLNKKKYLMMNICDSEALKKLLEQENFTHIINCSAYNAVDKAENDFEKANLLNNVAVKNLAKLANEFECELVHFSTDYVFDGEKGEPYKITDKPNPISNYGKTKYLGELSIEQEAKKYYLIRVSWLFGIFGDNFIKKVIAWSKKDEIKIAENEVSSPTYTEEVVIGTMKILEIGQHGKYHLCNSSCSRYDWAKFILDKIGFLGKLEKVQKEFFDLPAKRPKYSVMDTSETENLIAYKFSSWEDVTMRFLNKFNNLWSKQ